MANNLTYQQVRAWKDNVDNLINGHLINLLKDASANAKQLSTITKSSDENDLSYRFNDLTELCRQAASQLNTFMQSFDNSLMSYINTVKKSEQDTAEEARKKIDQFREAAEEISRLTM